MENKPIKQDPKPCKLELRLGLPGDDEEVQEESKTNKMMEGYNGNFNKTHHQSFSVGYFSSVTNTASCSQNPPWGYAKDSSQPCNSRMVQLSTQDNKNINSSHKRAAPAPVVGWPPVRSFRRNLTSNSSAKPSPNPPRAIPSPTVKANEKQTENNYKGLFVKINMDGVPIGRKVDLKAYDNYDKLCSVVDTLFRNLLAAQTNASSRGVENKQEDEKPITVLLDGSGEYTLVYEDNEGDRMLIGDIPWEMFVSTVKRLRVLKSSELPSLSKVAGKEGKMLKKS